MNGEAALGVGPFHRAWSAYKLRLRRRRLLLRALRKQRELSRVVNRSDRVKPGDILCFVTVRNEITRLPWFIDHHRNLGVDHFFVVDNGSDDGSAEFLTSLHYCSVWKTPESYRDARFGMDWLTALQFRYGHGHWCLTLDADEGLIYSNWEQINLQALTRQLESRGADVMSALMLDLYPKGWLSDASYSPGDAPTKALGWFDADNYHREYQPKFRNISIRGGVRKRVFFADAPDHAPHLHKTPLIKWHRRYVYLSSTHIALPRRLNRGFDPALNLPTGVLLHSKFLPDAIAKSVEEKTRREHFTHPGRYDLYYDRIAADPDLWCENSVRYTDWHQLVQLGLMATGDDP